MKRTLNNRCKANSFTLVGFFFTSFFSSMTSLSLLLALGMIGCSDEHDLLTGQSPATADQKSVPFSLPYTPSQNLDLDDSNNDLGLVSTATNIHVAVSGCASGYTVSSTTITSVVKLYVSDKNCLVKLTTFQFGSTTYSATASGATNFTTWLAGNTATFANTTLSTDHIKVFVKQQVTQTGVLTSDAVVYNFTDIQAGSNDTVTSIKVETGVPLSASGDPSPNFTVTASRFLSINSNGSANLSFTLQCGATLTGSSNSTYACSSILLQSQLDYIFITDAYSQGAITVAQANAAFAANTPTTIGTLIVAPGGADLNSNTLANGGFYTSNASPLVTGIPLSSSLNNVLMIRQKDTSANVQSFLYFYVDISTSTVSACGTYFAAGAGTSASPYQVNDATTLANTASCSTSTTFFIQTANIDLQGASLVQWTPIQLHGQYNGNGFTISNLYIIGASGTPIGLFNIINSGASVSNLTLSSVNITGSENIGSFAGQSSGSLTNSSASGTITLAGTSSSGSVGGLIGSQSSGSGISSSSSSVNIQYQATGTLNFLGGLVGTMTGSSISSSHATGSISATTGSNSNELALGGLVGNFSSSSISNSYCTGNLTSSISVSALWVGMIGLGGSSSSSVSGSFGTGTYSVSGSSAEVLIGGIVGQDTSSSGSPFTVSNSYTMVTTSVSGSGFLESAGIVAFSSSGAMQISSCYSASPSMTGSGSGFAAIGGPAISNSYLYQDGSDLSDSSSGVTTYTTSTQMQTQGNFSGFTFGTGAQNWKMPSANPLSPTGLLSPVLFWQCGSNGIVCP